MADQLILAQRFASVQTLLDKERGVFLEQASKYASMQVCKSYSSRYVASKYPVHGASVLG